MNEMTETRAGSTRLRLLDAAERLFAERGFEGTSVRDLTAEADCNLASVNYHFGGKEQLYREVFKRSMTELRKRRLAAIERVMAEPDVTLEALLRAFAQAFIEPLVEHGRGERLVMLFMREMTQPLLPDGMIFEQMIGPMQRVMHESIARLEPCLTHRQRLLSLHSLVGQLIHVVQMRRLFEASGPADDVLLDQEQVVAHIVRFTAAGMHEMSKGSVQP